MSAFIVVDQEENYVTFIKTISHIDPTLVAFVEKPQGDLVLIPNAGSVI
jgi:hypothetical protein